MTERLTSEADGLFTVLRQSADPETVAEIENFVAEARDRELCRVNAIDFAASRRLDEERVIAAFLHAARLGIFELSWNVLCPGCGGVLDTSTTLKSVKHDDYICALCAEGYQPNLDEMVEVTFTVSRRVRKIAAHEPDELPFFEYMRQIFWASGMNIPENLEELGQEITLDTLELPAGEKAQLSLQLPARVFDPVRSGDACRAVYRRQGRADPRAAEFVDGSEQSAGPDRHGCDAPWSTAAVIGEPHRDAGIAGDLDRRPCAARATGTAPAVPDREAPPNQPDLPRPLSQRHDRPASAPEDHQPDLPVHRPQRLDRAVPAGRRSRRLRSGSGAFPCSPRDRRRAGRGVGQDDRRCGDRDLPDPRPRNGRDAAHPPGK